jgi:hypothetical protein
MSIATVHLAAGGAQSHGGSSAGIRARRHRARQTRADDMVELEIDGVAVKIGRGADASVIAAVIDALKVTR